MTVIKEKHFDIFEMSKVMGISVDEITKSLKIPLKITTIEEARSIYKVRYDGNKDVRSVLSAWSKLSLREVKAAKNIQEIRTACQNFPKNFKHQDLAFEIWEKFSLEECKNAQTFADLEIAFHNCQPESPSRILVLEELIPLVETINDIKKVHGLCPKNHAVKILVLERWFSLARTAAEFNELYSYLHMGSKLANKTLKKLDKILTMRMILAVTTKEISDIHALCFDNSATEKRAAKIWVGISLKELESAMTVQEAKNVHNNALEKSVAAVKSLQKMIALSTTLTEIDEVLEDAYEYPELEEEALRKKLEISSTRIEVEAMFGVSYGFPKLAKLIVKKLASLIHTAQEMANIHHLVLCDSANCDSLEIIVMDNWIKLSLEEIESAVTSKQAASAYIHAPAGTRVKTLASKKWHSISDDEITKAVILEDLQKAFNNAPASLRLKALAKIATLFGWQPKMA